MRWVFAFALLFAAASARAQDKPVNLKLSTWLPPAHQINIELKIWAEDLEKTSNGTIKSTLFPAEQLGKAFDHYDMVRDGIADFGWVSPGYQPGRFPIVAASELPFLVANGKGATPAMDEWFRQYAPIDMPDTHVCFVVALDPGTLNGNKKILLPEDLRGVKVRPANATIGALVTLLGGTNVQASAPEARDVLERHVADEITFNWGSLMLFGIDRAVKYHMDLALYSMPFVWTMNKGRYESLSSGQRAVVDRHCTTEWAAKVAAPWTAFEEAGHVKLASMPGHEVYPLTQDQIAAWRKAAAPLKARWASQVKNGDPDRIFNDLTAALKRHGALAE